VRARECVNVGMYGCVDAWVYAHASEISTLSPNPPLTCPAPHQRGCDARFSPNIRKIRRCTCKEHGDCVGKCIGDCFPRCSATLAPDKEYRTAIDVMQDFVGAENHEYRLRQFGPKSAQSIYRNLEE